MSEVKVPLPPSPTKRPRYWYLTFLLAVVMTVLSMRYLSSDPEAYFEEQRETYIANRTVLLAHIGGAATALVLGAVQMLPGIRHRKPVVHRVLGRLYAVGVLIGAVFGLLLARDAFGGGVSTVGFGGLAIFWMATLVPAIGTIRRGDVAGHRRWMIRNYALTYAAVTLRLWLPLLAAIPGVDFVDAYRTVSWLCWVPNLIAVELFLRRGRIVNVSARTTRTAGT